MKPEDVTIIGAGLAGALLAILLARRGHPVQVYERLPDLRREAIPAGRSINLALAARGIRALELAGVMNQVRGQLLPMRGRMLHDENGTLTFVPYGQGDHEVIHSVSRAGLNRILLDAAEAAGVRIHFRHAALGIDVARDRLQMRDESQNSTHELPLLRVIGADGAGSALRESLVEELRVQQTSELLEHGYKELTLPPGRDGAHQIAPNALHVWPRGGFMLIALPNVDGSFTVTLFLPQRGPGSFAALRDRAQVATFFSRYFADVKALMPDLEDEFLAHPVGVMGTIFLERWSLAGKLLLIGDAAHAITPFHGQGMNCAFEDCRELDALLAAEHGWRAAATAFELQRHPNTDAIAAMALENYLEMRDTVREPEFQLQKMLSLELERRFPQRFVPRYSMVMFRHDIPYAVALERGRIQGEILDRLTRAATSLDDVDFNAATAIIEARLPPLPQPT